MYWKPHRQTYIHLMQREAGCLFGSNIEALPVRVRELGSGTTESLMVGIMTVHETHY